MKLWQAGIVVVASAGNFGPTAQSISVPGNNPYVITVGAMTDNYTPNNPADDGVTSFSSTGPTYEGFVKPDIVAPGGRMVGSMDAGIMTIPRAHPEFATANNMMYVMSGTSQSAAVVSGAVALMLQANPSLTPDQVKCRLMASAASKVKSDGKAAYSIFQQGTGMVNAYDAVYSQAANCANQGLNIANDIAGTAHYGGPARQDATSGAFYLVDSAGNRLSGAGYSGTIASRRTWAACGTTATCGTRAAWRRARRRWSLSPGMSRSKHMGSTITPVLPVPVIVRTFLVKSSRET